MCCGGTHILHITRAIVLLSNHTGLSNSQSKGSACCGGQDSQLQSQATRFASAANSKRTAPQWQPPSCVTKQSFPISVCRSACGSCQYFFAKEELASKCL